MDPAQAHLQPEQLDEANSWYCPKCKTHQQVGITRSVCSVRPDTCSRNCLHSSICELRHVIVVQAPVTRVYDLSFFLPRQPKSWTCGRCRRCWWCT